MSVEVYQLSNSILKTNNYKKAINSYSKHLQFLNKYFLIKISEFEGKYNVFWNKSVSLKQMALVFDYLNLLTSNLDNYEESEKVKKQHTLLMNYLQDFNKLSSY